ncbi:hypothetical protein FSARC_6758 [Fusarium sarcochroum]|uniref:Uncharacterized protein n=1 Tax=Fusarium sarcochroum TaxID=1208366 RepID=A0A8H4TWT9_9HYPO|nr:hypothetical protein FSARC_6758 [Fusarium sarcochroum]
MPDFRRLFFCAWVLTGCGCCRRRKPARVEQAKPQPVQAEPIQVRQRDEERSSSDYAQYSGISQSPSGVLRHPDEFEEMVGGDESGLSPTAAGTADKQGTVSK